MLSGARCGVLVAFLQCCMNLRGLPRLFPTALRVHSAAPSTEPPQGVIVQFRVMDGELRKGDLVKFMNTARDLLSFSRVFECPMERLFAHGRMLRRPETSPPSFPLLPRPPPQQGCEYDILELGVLSPKPVEARSRRARRASCCARSAAAAAADAAPSHALIPCLRCPSQTPHRQVDALFAGEVGYLAASIKQVADARVGDTITLKRQPAAGALPGYTEAQPMVFCGLFPTGERMGRANGQCLLLRGAAAGAGLLAAAPPQHACLPFKPLLTRPPIALPITRCRCGPVPRAARCAAQAAAERRRAQV